MTLHPLGQHTFRRAFWRLAGLSGVMTAFLGCENSEVTTVILGGLNDLAVTLVDAFFITIQPDDGGTPVTVSWLASAIGLLG